MGTGLSHDLQRELTTEPCPSAEGRLVVTRVGPAAGIASPHPDSQDRRLRQADIPHEGPEWSRGVLSADPAVRDTVARAGLGAQLQKGMQG